jgi:DNA-binding beta-propeller fold protein YncE
VAGPVYAEYNAATNQLVVADYDGNAVSIIDVSLDEYGNDSPTFGTTYTVPVGKNPASVTVLVDGSRAYTANQADGVQNGTVSIVDMSSGVHVLEKTLAVVGHPRTVVSTQNSSYGKVYVASPDTPYLTIIRTDLDIVDTSVLVEGNIVDVRVTTQNGVSLNNNNVSRVPGFGQPCNLPGEENSKLTLTACQTLP